MRRRSRPLLMLGIASTLFTSTLMVGIWNNQMAQAFIFGFEDEALRGAVMETVTFAKEGTWSWCLYEDAEDTSYSVNLLETKMPDHIESGESFSVEMHFENTGTKRIFSTDSGCEDRDAFVVSSRLDNDEGSLFAQADTAVYGWLNSSDLEMKERYADPGEEFSVVFQSTAPAGDDIRREFFQARVADEWLDETFALDFEIGEPTEEMQDMIQYVSLQAMSASELVGQQKSFEIDISDQRMYAVVGEERIWEMVISSGHWQTPTPRGTYHILNMQELRVGYAWPHYHMPYWMGWRSDGYGIHGLPYLENDNGAFWQEASDHLGIPLSHGCIRVGGGDIETAYQFAYIGMPIVIHQ